MGRVDEAMRRAAEVSGRGAKVDAESVDLRVEHFQPAVAGGDAHDGSAAERLRLKPVVSHSPFGGRTLQEPQKPTAPKIPLIDRIPAKLAGKLMVDTQMNPIAREQYRRLATRLHAAQADAGIAVLLVTSAVAGEGKSLTAANLALTFSESYQRRVLLIDGDLRRPSLHHVFDVPSVPGLSESLLAPEDHQLPSQVLAPRLTLLPSGVTTGDPMKVLASERMRRLVTEARGHFDWVLIDTPPVGLLSDASLLSSLVDGVILVVNAGETQIDLVSRSADAIGRERILGVVLNQSEQLPSGTGKYSSYYHASPAR